MSGRELYELYARLQLEIHRCGVDVWADIGASEQRVWEAMAEQLKVCGACT